MSKICAVCGKGPSTGNTVSHSQRKGRRRWLPNLQPVRLVINGTSRRVRVCTRCLRSGKLQRAL